MKKTTLSSGLDHAVDPSAASKRRAFTEEWLQRKQSDGKVNMAELCRQYRISRKTGYKWLERWDPEDPQSLNDRSRVPHRQPGRTSDEIVQLIVQARERNPDWGPRRLRSLLIEERPDLQFPAESTFGQILRRNGLIGKGSQPSNSVSTGESDGHGADADAGRSSELTSLSLRDIPHLVTGHGDSVMQLCYQRARRDYIAQRLERLLAHDPRLRHLFSELPAPTRRYALVYPLVLELMMSWKFDEERCAIELRRFIDGVERGEITLPSVAGTVPGSPLGGLPYVTDAYIGKKPEFQPVSDAVRSRACGHVDEAMELIREISPYTAEFITRFVDLCCLADDPRTLRCSSGSFNRLVGLIFIRNAHLGSRLNIADGLIHESIHELLFSYELKCHPLFPANRPPFIRSPWSGNMLPPDAYVHACVVWFSLAHFWRHALHKSVPEAETFLERAYRGFLSQPITRPLVEGHSGVAPKETMALLGNIERRMSAEHWPVV